MSDEGRARPSGFTAPQPARALRRRFFGLVPERRSAGRTRAAVTPEDSRARPTRITRGAPARQDSQHDCPRAAPAEGPPVIAPLAGAWSQPMRAALRWPAWPTDGSRVIAPADTPARLLFLFSPNPKRFGPVTVRSRARTEGGGKRAVSCASLWNSSPSARRSRCAPPSLRHRNRLSHTLGRALLQPRTAALNIVQIATLQRANIEDVYTCSIKLLID